MESIRAMMNEFLMMPDYTIRRIALRCESVLWRVYRAVKDNTLARGYTCEEAASCASREVTRAAERLIVALQKRDVPGADVIATAAETKFFKNCHVWEIGIW